MRRLSLSALLYLLAGLALLSVLAMAAPEAGRVYGVWRETDRMIRLEALSGATTRFLDSLPIEATSSVPVLQQGTPEAIAANARAARETDAALAALRERAAAVPDLAPAAQAFLRQIFDQVPRIADFRSRLAARSVGPTDSAALFVPISEIALALSGQLAIATQDGVLTRIGLANHALLNLHNGNMMERGGGLRMLGQATPPPAAIALFQRGLVVQAVYRERLGSLGSLALNARIAAFDATPARAALLAQRTAMQAGQGTTVPAEAWLASFTAQSEAYAAIIAAGQQELAEAVALRREAAGQQAMLLFVGVGAILAILLLVTQRILRMVSRIVGEIGQSLHALGEGQFDVAIPGVERQDALGLIARSAHQMRDSLAEGRRLQQAQEAEARAREERALRIAGHVRGFQQTIGTLVRTVSDASATLTDTARGMSQGARQVDDQSNQVANSADLANSNVQAVSAAAEELACSVQEISRQLARSTEVTSRAVEETRRSDALVGSLADTAQKIGDVLGLISTIAGQTNLLALNATIEAARAGESGKGFAVVASEVKALAAETAKATEEIGAQIGQIQGATGHVVEAFRSVSAVIEEVNQIAAAIAAAVEEQGAATQEIARSIQAAASATRDVAGTIQGVRDSASGSGRAANDVLGAAEILSAQATTLSQEVGTFIGRVEAA
ncbi:methyl-accepting chemotaxis protein [Roseomonas sp. F4]